MNRKSASWAKSIKQIFSPVRKKRTSARLSLECLGDRIVPAPLNAASAAVDGAKGSLRAAITEANTNADASNTITLDAGTFTILPGATGDNANASGDFDIFNGNTAKAPLKEYIFLGQGAGVTIVNAAQVDRVFQILGSDVKVTFKNLSITGGVAFDNGDDAAPPLGGDVKGGGILNYGDGKGGAAADVTLDNVVVFGNAAGTPGIIGGAPGKTGSVAVAGAAGNPGTNGGNGFSAFGGGIYSAGGTLTITGANASIGGGTLITSQVNIAFGGAGGRGGDGGDAGAGAVGKAGGNGGNGGNGGDAFGAGIYAESGTVIVTGGALVQHNVLDAGAGGAGGTAGDNGATSGFGGAGGKGGNAGKAGGAGIYMANGSVVIDNGQVSQNGVGAFAKGGAGGAGGAAPGVGGRGGNGGVGGDGGAMFGGGIAIATGDVTVKNGAQVASNFVAANGTNATSAAGNGGAGGAGGAGLAVGGNGAAGGNGGNAFGGGIYAADGDVLIDTGSKVRNNAVNVSAVDSLTSPPGTTRIAIAGGHGGAGGGGKRAGNGGAGGNGGDAGGGGVYIVSGNLSLAGGAGLTNNVAIGGAGGAGIDGQGVAVATGVAGNGGAGGSGGSAEGGGAFVGTGDIAVSGASAITGNQALGGHALFAGAGGVATGNKGRGGNGGLGGDGGDAFGGGFYAGDGTVSVSGGLVQSNLAQAGDAVTNAANAGDGGAGKLGAAPATAGTGGAGAAGGDGGKAGGGGIYSLSGDVTLDQGVIVGGAAGLQNFAHGGAGGIGGKGGNGGIIGGAGAAGGNGGAAVGGGVGAAAGNVTIQGGAQLINNRVKGRRAGVGGDGGDAQTPAGSGGAAGNGGKGGAGHGGGVWALNGDVLVSGAAQFTSNTATAGRGLGGGVGGDGLGKAGAGGNGGDGADAAGGAIWIQDGSVTVSGTSTFTSNGAFGGFPAAGHGGNRGAGGGAAANGNGGAGADAFGGAIWAGAADVAIGGHSIFRSNGAGGGRGGDAATGVGGGLAGTGGRGGDAVGGVIYAQSGDVSVNTAQFANNGVGGGNGGAGGAIGNGLGAGGNGGLSAGGAIAIISGSAVIDGGAIGVGTFSSSSGNGVGGDADGGADALAAGNGGDALGGGLYAPATAVSVVVTNSSFFRNTANSAGEAGGATGKDGNSQGGAIYAAAKTVSISNTTIAGNQAFNFDVPVGTPGVSEGGGVYINSPDAKIHNSTVVYNYAGTGFNTGGTVATGGQGGGIRNKGTLDLVSTIVGRNNITATTGLVANVASGNDISNTGGTIGGDHNLVENALGSGLTAGDKSPNGNIGNSFVSPTFHQTVLTPPTVAVSQNTVFVDSPTLGIPQLAPNGTQFLRLVTPAEFATASVFDPLTKLPAGALSALSIGANPDNLPTDQAGKPRSNLTPNGLTTDVGAIQGNNQVVATSGAKVVSAVFSGTQPNTYDKVVVTFDQAMQTNTFGPGDITLLDPNGKQVTILAVTPETGSTTVFDVTFAPQGVAGVYSYTQGVDILNLPAAGGFQMNQNGNSVNGEVPPTSPDDLFRTTATLVVPPGQAGILAVGNVGGTVRILQANDGTQIANVQPLGTSYKGGVSVALADFDGDGTADLAVSAVDPVGVNGLTADKAGKIFIYDGVDLAKGTLTLTNTLTPFATSTSGGAYTNGLNVAAGDINGDGNVDIVAGSRGQIGSANGPIGKVEQGRLAVVNVADGALIGSIITPFGAGYQKGVVVATGDLDGVVNGTGHTQDEIGVTRGGPVAKSLPPAIQTIKLKAFQFAGAGLVELDLAGNGGTSAFAPFAPLNITRDARVAFVDTDGDGKSQLVFSALDRTTTNTQVRIAAFDVNTTSGLATPVSTGTGPSNSYVVGNNIIDHSIAAVAPNGGNLQNLVLVTQSTTSQVQYLDPLNGSTATTGFAIALVNGGVNVDGF